MLLQKALQVLLHISKRAFHGLKALRGMPKALNLHYNAKNIQFRTLQIKYMEQILQPRFLFIQAYNFSSMNQKKKSATTTYQNKFNQNSSFYLFEKIIP